MKRVEKVLDKEYISLGIAMLCVVLVMLLDSLGNLQFLRNGISFIFEPAVYSSSQAGSGGNRYLQAFIKLSEFRKEYNQLKIDVLEKDVNNSYFAILKEENESLKKQILLGDVSKKYIQAKTVYSENVDYMNIDVGSQDGVDVGNIVSFGNMYVGQVLKVDRSGSLVRLLSSKESRFEVLITHAGVKDGKVTETPNILSKAVVVGTADGIRVENISSTAEVKEGDVVLMNDSRVGSHLVIGYLVSISDNPSSTSKSGYVSPIVDYDSLLTVFVKI